MYRQFFEASEISSLLTGFSVANVRDSEWTDEDGKKSDNILIVFVNEHHVAVDMLIGEYGSFVSEPYAVKDDLSVIKNSETKC